MNQVQLINQFRAGTIPIPKFLSQVERNISTREPSVLSLVPEENRHQRLHEEAKNLSEKYPEPENRPPLFGMLVGVKDIIHVDGIITKAGSQIPSEALQGDEAKYITRLKEAGALIFGKTVTAELAYFTPGPTRNPHNPEHTPGGSSSGSAAVVGGEILPLAIGTQEIGSVIRPASFCGVVGYKPTYDRVPRDGAIPLAPSLDHVGLFTQDVSTARLVASVITEDWSPSSSDRKPILGIPEGPYLQNASDESLACFNENCQSLADAGYELRSVAVMPDFDEIYKRHDVILSAEASQVHAEWFAKYGDKYSPTFTNLIHRGRSVSNGQLEKAFADRDEFRAEMYRVMEANEIDLWVTPSTVGPAPIGLEDTGDPTMNLPWTQIGFPALTIPAGKSSNGLPLGLQITGKGYEDESTLAWAEDIEKVVGIN